MSRLALLTATTFLLVLLTACGEKEAPAQEEGNGEVIEKEAVQQVMPNGELTHPDYGRETFFAYGAVTGTEETPANGVVQSQLFENKSTFILSANVNIRPPEEGSLVAWLQDDEGNTVRAGVLTQPFDDVRHTVHLQTNTDYSAYRSLIVTIENDSEAEEPSDAIVATGTLKQVQR